MMMVWTLTFMLILIVALFSKKIIHQLLDTKVSLLLLGGLFLVLILVNVYSLFLPTSSSPYRNVSAEEANEGLENYATLIQEAYEGKLEGNDAVLKLGEWTFPLKGDLVTLTNRQPSMVVLVERDPSLVGEVEVTHYVGQTYVLNRDITKARAQAEVNMKEDELTMDLPMTNFSLDTFHYGFMYEQFTGAKVEWFGDHASSIIGSDYLYVKVPEKARINGMFEEVKREK